MAVGENGSTDMYKENVVELASIFKTAPFGVASKLPLLLKIDDYYVKDIPIVCRQ